MSRALALALVLIVTSATAAPTNIDTLQFHPPSTSGGFLGVDGAFTAPHLGFSVGLFGSYAHNPLVLRDSNGRIPVGGVVIRHQLSMDLQASFALWERLELGVVLPFVPVQTVDNTLYRDQIAGAGLGDLRIDLKVRVLTAHLGGTNRLGLAVIAGIAAPIGTSGSFFAEGSVSGWPRLILEWRNRVAQVAVGFGAILRSTRSYNDLYVTHQLSYHAAASVRLVRDLFAIGEVAGLAGVGLPADHSFLASEAPLEARVGLRFRSSIGLEGTLAGGAGLSRGYGIPDGRFIFGLRYETPTREKLQRRPAPVVELPPDGDGDGVSDRDDRCPDAKGPPQTFGCPDIDSDGDGIVDRLDRCPLEHGTAAKSGCPDQSRVFTDRDEDGVPDDEDRCPDQKGSEGNQGCPDIDSDGDGYVDRLDKCPFEPEVWNGVTDEDGCPDAGPALVEPNAARLVLKQQPIFEGVELTADPLNDRILRIVAMLMVVHPEIPRLGIDVYTDNQGSAMDNLERSRDRAVAVRRRLIELGVDGKRLLAGGFGADRPVADNRTPAGRAKNRCVELVIQRLPIPPDSPPPAGAPR